MKSKCLIRWMNLAIPPVRVFRSRWLFDVPMSYVSGSSGMWVAASV